MIVRPVSDELLLHLVEISASLIGLFLVGVFFYVEAGLGRWTHAREVFRALPACRARGSY